jgi:pilus assembly protein TadC
MHDSKKKSELILRRKLRVAGVNKAPKEFLGQTMRSAIVVGVAISVLAFFLAQKKSLPLILAPVAGIIFAFLSYITLLKTLDTKIHKKAKEIDKDVLFAGRFLLIKLNSGKPLINSLMEASESYGVSNTYFKQIIKNIELGTPLEKALEMASDECPSNKMKRVIFQISNALKIGIDVTQNLEAVLEEIAYEQLIEIQKYGKKLNSLTLFYMLLAVVVPSLGMTMFIVVAGLVSLNLTSSTFFIFAFFLLMIELVFLSLFKSIRPNVNI